MQQRLIIIFFIILFVLSSAYLFFVSEKYQDPNYRQDWWALYFQDAKDNDANFVIENYSNNDNFYWQVLAGKEKRSEGNIIVKKGETKEVEIGADIPKDKKITVTVFCGNDRKEIYKNINL